MKTINLELNSACNIEKISDDLVMIQFVRLLNAICSNRGLLDPTALVGQLGHVIDLVHEEGRRNMNLNEEQDEEFAQEWDSVSSRHLGVPVADRILDALRDKGSKGLSRTDISTNIFKRHKKRWEIDEALALLRKEGLAYLSEPSDEKRKPEEGRPPEIWKAVQQGAKKAN
jgi:hypothetical protein